MELFLRRGYLQLIATSYALVFVGYALFTAPIAEARPTIRELRTHSEFTKLIDHHRDSTGLPVIVDYYSHSCGPCRSIAPHFKSLAEQYKDKAVFAKVDVNSNRETSSKNHIRSMPTFQFWSEGNLIHKFAGADLHQLQNYIEKLVSEAERNNVKITKENLAKFYHDVGEELKTNEANLEMIMEKAGTEGGLKHRQLAQALKKKYGKAPKLEPRFKASSPKAQEPESANQQQTAGDEASFQKKMKVISDDILLNEIKRRGLSFHSESNSDSEENEDDFVEDPGEEIVDWRPSESDLKYAERVVIIGSGPAGLTAALYAARAGLKPLVIAPREGGQLQGKGVLVENFPGILGASGNEVVLEIKRQAASFGTRFMYAKVSDVDFKDDIKKIVARLEPSDGLLNSSNEENTRCIDLVTLTAQSVILATGSDARWLNVPGEDRLKGRGISACATCDGYLFVGKDVIVIGGGDSAMEEALHLAQTSASVTIIHRKHKFRASAILQQRVREHPKIKAIFNSLVSEFVAGNINSAESESTEEDLVLTQVALTNTIDGSVSTINIDGAFVAIGHDPNTGYLQNSSLRKTEFGYIVVEPFTTKTSIEGVFACGDIADSVYRQAITSAGSGSMSAIDAEHYLIEKGFTDEKAAEEEALMKELMNEFKIKSK